MYRCPEKREGYGKFGDPAALKTPQSKGMTMNIAQNPETAILPDYQVLALVEIATKAVELHKAEEVVRERKAALDEGYKAYKEEIGISFIERDSDEWAGMMEATEAQYNACKASKRDVKNAKRRLDTSIAKYRLARGVAQ